MTKKEALTPVPPLVIFQEILSGYGLICDSKDWHPLISAFHLKWLKPLLENGYVEQTKKEPATANGGELIKPEYHYYSFKALPAGIAWWVEQKTLLFDSKDYEACGPLRIDSLAEWSGDRPPVMDGKGIGAVIRFDWWRDICAAIKAIGAGYFEFVEYRQFRCEEHIIVRLTESGMRHFDSVPRLQLECA